MHTSTIVVFVCLVAAVAANTYYEQYPANDAVHIPEDAYEALETPAHERSARTKRGLLLLKKKLLLGALGLKAAKVGAVGAAGVAGALALKKKHASHSHSVPVVHSSSHYGYNSKGPEWNVEVHSWH